MLKRAFYIGRLAKAVRRSRITALLGPRQCGKTTLAREFAKDRKAHLFDLESQPDISRLRNAELALSSLDGLVIVDEIQVMPGLFQTLRALVDGPSCRARFLVLGSASPQIVRGESETLAGRVEFVELAGFDLGETGGKKWQKLWSRGGFPRSYLSASDDDSVAWREGFIKTFLERDIPQLGIGIPAAALRRFWIMLAHYHGQVWNASELGRSMGLSDKTVRSYLDILTGTYMIRQLQPWHENISKRQIKAPKIYFRDTGLLHNLLGLRDMNGLLAHPRAGSSWEGFVIEQALQAIRPSEAFFWGTHTGNELDLFFMYNGKRYGMEIKISEAPKVTRSMHIALETLGLEHLWLIYPGEHIYPAHEKITALPVHKIQELSIK
ncbi:MAG TPA: ATP-binding protein [Dissulfurispiraceae bacterium]|nr:ATP-binding protein [Dissulfurispiraceae bacterium]